MEYITFREAADKFGVSISTISRWVKSGILSEGPKVGKAKTVSEELVKQKLNDSLFMKSIEVSRKKEVDLSDIEKRIERIEEKVDTISYNFAEHISNFAEQTNKIAGAISKVAEHVSKISKAPIKTGTSHHKVADHPSKVADHSSKVADHPSKVADHPSKERENFPEKIMTFRLRGREKKDSTYWNAYRYFGGKQSEVYIGTDLAYANQKITAWLDKHPEYKQIVMEELSKGE